MNNQNNSIEGYLERLKNINASLASTIDRLHKEIDQVEEMLQKSQKSFRDPRTTIVSH